MDEPLIDRAHKVRTGEEIDLTRLSAYLRSAGKEYSDKLHIEQFPSGFSNLTYLLRNGDEEFVLRRPPIGSTVKTAHDMRREFEILTHLHPFYSKVPKPILLCEDESVLGTTFYLMERVKGVILRAAPPRGANLTSEVMHSLSKTFIENLVEIHAVDYTQAGLADIGKPAGYISRQVDGWTRRYHGAQTDEVPVIEDVARWLIDNMPVESNPSLIHNDYKYDNVVFKSLNAPVVAAVLDWEMATIGDPLMDLGTTLAYWIDMDDPEDWKRLGFGLTSLPGNLRRQEILDLYSLRSQRQVSDIVFYYTFGLLKIAVIVQQIFYRFKTGKTSDPRFSNLGILVEAAGNMARRSIEKNRIVDLG
jgi:aminoglycoside phosphotransferase (APT) family kinase protein